MDDIINGILIAISVTIIIAIISILLVCCCLRVLFFRSMLPPIRGAETLPGIYALEVPLQLNARRRSIFQALNNEPRDGKTLSGPTDETG